MKKIIFIAALLTGLSAHASGKLSAQANVYDQGEHTRPVVGLAIYEQLMKFRQTSVAFNSFTGFGEVPFDTQSDITWFTTKNQLDLSNGKWTFSPGVQFLYSKPSGETRSLGFVKLSYNLW